MLKALMRLTLIIIIPLLILLYAQAYNPIYLIRNEINKQYFVENYRGTFYLINESLNHLPKAQWPLQFKHITEQFGLPIKFTLLQDTSFNESQIRQLNNQDYIYSGGEPSILSQQIANTSWVIQIDLNQSRQAKILQQTQGTIYLIEKKLALSPQQEWPDLIKEMADQFGLPLAINPIDEVALTQNQLMQMAKHNGTLVVVEEQGDTTHRRLMNSDWILSAGPISEGQANIYMIIGVMLIFMVVIVLGLLSWLMPLWRDLKALDYKALQFGKGKLDSRIQLKKSSAINSLGNSFNVMANNIQKLIHSNQQLTNAVAHDLRTPLARLKFALEILETEECSEDEKIRYQKSINSSIDSLDYLINQTLIHARYSRAADIKHFTMSHIASVITDEFEQQSRHQLEIQFSLHIDDDLADSEQLADPRAITRALSNLLSNAKRFANHKIQVSFTTHNNQYLITVEDDGPGIDMQEKENIFQPFSQVNNDERSAAQGHGLGLAIVYQIALWHKGQVSVARSSLGGAKFELAWPINQ